VCCGPGRYVDLFQRRCQVFLVVLVSLWWNSMVRSALGRAVSCNQAAKWWAVVRLWRILLAAICERKDSHAAKYGFDECNNTKLIVCHQIFLSFNRVVLVEGMLRCVPRDGTVTV
jgi:hypothetical protein